MTRASWTGFVALLVFTMGTSIITPLIPLYQDEHGLSNGEMALLFGAYPMTVVPAMLLFGNLSDLVGRRAVMIPAMACLTAASLILGFTDEVSLLFVGRVLQGLAVGGFLGVGTALVVDHAPPHLRARAAVMAGIGFRLGFGLGPGLAGLVAQYLPDPLHLSFQMHAALMSVAVVCVLVTPETVRRGGGRLRIAIGVPPGQLAAFATFLAPSVFLLGVLDATLLAVVPLYLADTLAVDNVAVIGLVGFLVLGLTGVTPLVARNLDPRTAVITGVAAGSGASLLVVGASLVGSPLPVLAAAGLIGFLNGLILQGCTAICGISVPITQRGKLISALYMCAYFGTAPAIGLGYLSQSIGLTATLGVFSAGALALAAFVLLVGARTFRVVIPYVEVPPPVPPPAPLPA